MRLVCFLAFGAFDGHGGVEPLLTDGFEQRLRDTARRWRAIFCGRLAPVVCLFAAFPPDKRGVLEGASRGAGGEERAFQESAALGWRCDDIGAAATGLFWSGNIVVGGECLLSRSSRETG